VSGLPEKFGTTTFPTLGCGYTAGQLCAAYGAITSQVTLPGYDNMTGLGTPNGPAFILRASEKQSAAS
jgi:hypothetical protein